MINYPLRWFCQRKDNRLVTNKYSGSYGTSPTLGLFNRPIFEYSVEVIVIDDDENKSCLRGESTIKEYRKSGTKQLAPKKEIVLIGITEENLKVIDSWLEKMFIEYSNKYNNH